MMKSLIEVLNEALEELSISEELKEAGRLVNQAFDYYKGHKYVKAEESSRQSIELFSYYPGSYFILANACLRQGKFEEAAQAFEKEIEIQEQFKDVFPEFGGYKTFFFLGVCYYIQSDYEKGIQAFEKAAEISPKKYTNVSYWFSALCYKAQDKVDEVEKVFKRMIETDPNDFSVYKDLGLLYQQQKRLQEAEEMFKKAIEIDPKMPVSFYCLGDFYLEQGKLEEAKTAFQKADELGYEGAKQKLAEIEETPKEDEYKCSLFSVEDVHFEVFPEKGEVSDESETQETPKEDEYKCSLFSPENIHIEVFPEKGEDEQSELPVEEISLDELTGDELKKPPSPPYRLGNESTPTGYPKSFFAESKRKIKESSSKIPSFIPYRIYKQNRYKEFRRFLQKQIESNPKDVSAFFWLANCCEREGDLDGYDEAFRKATSLNQSFLDYMYKFLPFDTPITTMNAGSCEMLLKETEDFYAYFWLGHEYLELRHLNYGLLFNSDKSYEKAKECFQKAIEIAPNFYPAYSALGFCSVHERDYEEAIKTIQKITHFNPDYLFAHLWLGLCHLSQGNRKAAEEELSYPGTYELADSIHMKPHEKYPIEGEINDMLSKIKSLSTFALSDKRAKDKSVKSSEESFFRKLMRLLEKPIW